MAPSECICVSYCHTTEKACCAEYGLRRNEGECFVGRAAGECTDQIPDVSTLQHRQRPSVDGDVLSCASHEQCEKDESKRGNVRGYSSFAKPPGKVPAKPRPTTARLVFIATLLES